MVHKYFLRSINEPELVECQTCHGTGAIKGSLVSDALDAPIENTTLSCPKCNGQGKVSTGKMLHWAIGQVFIYGEANVSDGDESMEYLLGFVCEDESIITTYKEQNGISSFVKVPGALRFYGKSEVLYDTLEEAQAALAKAEAEWTDELKLVEPES